MVTITSALIDEVLQPTKREPSARTIRSRQMEEDARQVVKAIEEGGAALITLTDDDLPTPRYLHGLRSAFRRLGYGDILLQKRRGQDRIAAWRERPEDSVRLEIRRQTGKRLGAKARAKKPRMRP
jgi:hypothetical protein